MCDVPVKLGTREVPYILQHDVLQQQLLTEPLSRLLDSPDLEHPWLLVSDLPGGKGGG